MTKAIPHVGVGTGGERKRTATRVALVGIVLVSLVLAGCQSTDRYWSFPAVRDLRKNGLLVINGLSGFSGGSGCGCSSKSDAYALLFALAFVITSPIWEPVLRLGIDVALLPITGGHDLWLYCQGDAEYGKGESVEEKDRALDSYWVEHPEQFLNP